ncbi:MAG: phosphoribosylformylglycinamidine synthase I [Candidatus Tantalella remota]|nr:phosphoribosylformylglycinamidine synthase I [Candidatus Tantalella remota]
MKKIKTLILRTAGTNCDMETAFAFKQAGSGVDMVHINELIRKKSLLSQYQILAIPGGFTYGDDVASGKILANELKFNLSDQINRFIFAGKPVIGICNGFQVLVKMGLLPDTGEVRGEKIEATLSLNDSGRFEDRWIHLKSEKEQGKRKKCRCIWTKDIPEVMYMPIAHAEGKFIPKDEKSLNLLKSNGQVVFRYTDSKGAPAGYPDNPNGSVDDIAGLCDPSGRVLGMMPHPERHAIYLQHPNWRRFPDRRKEMGTGIRLFENGVKFAKNQL